MPETVIYLDRSRIRPVKLEPLKRAIEDLVEFIESREPQLSSATGLTSMKTPAA